MRFWLCVVATVLIVESLLPVLMPRRWQALLLELVRWSPQQIRRMGLVLMVLGWLLLLWLGPEVTR